MTFALPRRAEEHVGHGPLKAGLAGGLVAFAVKAASAALSYAMFATFAKIMTPSDYGSFAMAFSMAIVASAVGSVGLATAVLRFLAEHLERGRPDLARGFVVFGGLATGGASLVISALMTVLAWSVHAFRPVFEVPILYNAAFLSVAFSASEYVSSLLRARGIVAWSLAPRDVAWRAVLVAGAGCLLGWGLQVNASSVLWAATAALIAVTVVQAFHAAKQFRPLFSGEATLSFACPQWMSAAWPMWGAAILFALVQQFDVVLVGMLLKPEDAGEYFAALRTASLLSLILIAANMICAPVFSRHFHGGSLDFLRNYCRSVAALVSIPTILALGLLILAGRPLLAFFDGSFVSAYPVLVVLALAFAFDCLCGPTAYLMQMIGRERTHFHAMVVTYVATLAAQIVFTPAIGLMGTAIPCALGIVFWNIWAVHRLRRDHGIDCSILGLFTSRPKVQQGR
jgi:O-antigen/teichoic acid export membrane protein